jgi:hypothetical protein
LDRDAVWRDAWIKGEEVKIEETLLDFIVDQTYLKLLACIEIVKQI